MAAVRALLEGVVAWLRARLRGESFRRVVYVGELYDVPELLDPAAFYVAGAEELPKWAAFACPCGTGHRVVLSLQAGHRPHWRLAVRAGAPSIWPSVDVLGVRRCHYWIRAGHVEWAGD